MAEAGTGVLRGRYFAGGSSSALVGTVVAEGDNCAVRGSDGVTLGEYPLADVRYSYPLAGNPWRFDFPDGSIFETGDNAGVKQWLSACSSSKSRRWEDRLEGSWKWALAALALMPVLVMVVIFKIMPWVAAVGAEQVPPAVLGALDRQVLANMDGRWLQASRATAAEKGRLDSAWSALGEPPDLQLELRRSDALGANAMALPGGTIVVTDKLLEVMDNREQVIAVIAHEIGHVRARHGVRNLIQTIGVAALLATVVGDVSGLAESLLVTGPTLLQQMRYSREFETEADEFARTRLQSLDIRTSCLGSSLRQLAVSRRKIQAEQTAPGRCSSPEAKQEQRERPRPEWFDYLSTHPGIDERISLSGGTACP